MVFVQRLRPLGGHSAPLNSKTLYVCQALFGRASCRPIAWTELIERDLGDHYPPLSVTKNRNDLSSSGSLPSQIFLGKSLRRKNDYIDTHAQDGHVTDRSGHLARLTLKWRDILHAVSLKYAFLVK